METRNIQGIAKQCLQSLCHLKILLEEISSSGLPNAEQERERKGEIREGGGFLGQTQLVPITVHPPSCTLFI